MDYKDFTIQNNTENYFWYKARKALINDLLHVVFKNYDSHRLILEIGCGTGYQIPVLKKWGRVEGFDINSNAVEVAVNKGFNVQVKDLENDDIDTNPDVVCLFDVLEHIRDHNAAIKKIFSVLKNDGFLFLTVPAYNFMFSGHDKAMGHFRRYDKRKLISLLENSGFQIVKSGYWNCLLFPCVLLIRLFKNFLGLFIKKESHKSEVSNLSPLINNFLYKVLLLENFLIRKKIKCWWGLSIFIISKKH